MSRDRLDYIGEMSSELAGLAYESGHVTLAQVLEMAALEAATAHRPIDGRVVGTWCWNLDQDLFVADAALAKFIGADIDKARNGAPLAKWMRGVHPNDRAALHDRIDVAKRTGLPFEHRYRVVVKNRTLPVASRGRCVMREGMPTVFPGSLIALSHQAARA